MRNGRTSDILLSLTLILLLAICSFMVLFYEASGYKTMNDENQLSEDAHIPYSYLMNKMRRGKSISCEQDELIVVEEKSETHIYLMDGYLYELTSLIGSDIDRSAGDRIFVMDGFSVDDDGKTIKISYSVKGIEKRLVFSRRTDDE